MVDGDDVLQAAQACRQLLEAEAGRSWDVVAPDVAMSVRALVAHMAQCCVWYTVDLAAAGRPCEAVTVRVDEAGPATELMDAIDVGAALLAQTVDAAPAAQRGFHPFGSADPSGFAAMACDELLIHTADVAAAWGVEWQGDAGLAGRVTSRLFPWALDGHDPWPTLLWCSGRQALGDHDRLQRWRWHCAPLDEWDGSVPSFVTAAQAS